MKGKTTARKEFYNKCVCLYLTICLHIFASLLFSSLVCDQLSCQLGVSPMPIIII